MMKYFFMGVFVLQLCCNPVFAQTAYITGQISTGQSTDTLTLKLYDELNVLNTAANGISQYRVVTRDGQFSFALPVTAPGVYFDLWSGGDSWGPQQLLLFHYFVEPGDNVQIGSDLKNTTFTGKGAAKMECLYQVSKLHMGMIRCPVFSELLINAGNVLSFMNALDLVRAEEEEIVDRFKDKINTLVYQLLKADVAGEIGWMKYRYGAKFVDSPGKLQPIMQRLSDERPDTTLSGFSLYAEAWVDWLVQKAMFDEDWKKKAGVSVVKGAFAVLMEDYAGALRDKLMMHYLIKTVSDSGLKETELAQAMQVVRQEPYRTRVQALADAFGKGRQAIDFSLKDSRDRTVRLSDLKGKVVFVDTWFSGCGGCVAVAKAMPGVEAAFAKDPRVVFVSISIDKDRALWLRSISKGGNVQGQTTKHYSHYTTETTRYLYTGGKGSEDPFINTYIPTNTYPHLLLIDGKGKIFSADLPRPDEGDGKEVVIRMIREAIEASN